MATAALLVPVLAFFTADDAWSALLAPSSEDGAASADPVITLCSTSDEPYMWYRLGDMILNVDGLQRSAPEGEQRHFACYPHSIASEYMRRTVKDDELAVLADIIHERLNHGEHPRADQLVVHLRVGDIIDNPFYSNYTVDELLNGTARHPVSSYVMNESYFKEVAREVRNAQPEIRAAVLVYGAHLMRHDEMPKSFEYVARVQSVLSRYFPAGVAQRGSLNTTDPDDDFLYMTRARAFAMSGGGFSELVARMVTRIGDGQVWPLSRRKTLDEFAGPLQKAEEQAAKAHVHEMARDMARQMAAHAGGGSGR